ncbi:MAG: tRNA 2-thiouridine(34) synthase MnmA [Oscillospiraceae bacterium]|nr:tRNA 2-thiouridine(34) synthase MnmA [Oscillospiraceae bacterium]
MKKVVLGLSGGVDSAVCARLLQNEGYEVSGLYLDIGDENARNDAVKTAEFLGVELKIEDVSARLEEKVCTPFLQCYLRGETPNPCIMCNPAVKFERLINHANEIGAEYIATGHYARTENGAILKAKSSNDQSYMLCRLTREQASRLLLPLGEYEKTEVRALAESFGIPVASKPDSMEICFIPDKDYAGWIAARAEIPKPGNFIFDGKVIGTHEGIHRWTVGQRMPGLYNERKVYVCEIRPETDEVVLCLWEDLFKTEVRARDVSWLIDIPEEPIRGSVKVRHTKWENPECTITATPDGGMVVITDEPVRAPARGQAAVIYSGERLLGGGYIV